MVGATKDIIKRIGGRLFRRLFPLSPIFQNIQIILMYHRVLKNTPEGLYDPALFVTASSFEMHLRELTRFFHLVPIQSILEQENGLGRRLVITFDDGWVDNYEVAFPLLKIYRVPATIFVPPAIIGSNHNFWFENLYDLANHAITGNIEQQFVSYFHSQLPSWKPERMNSYCLAHLASALKRLPADTLDELLPEACKQLGLVPSVQNCIIDWNQAAEMGRSNVSFGAHGLHHYILPTLDGTKKRREIQRSLELLKGRGLPTVPIFSFPNGDWDTESIKLLAEEGYQGAVTTNLGYNTSLTSPFFLSRVGLHEHISHTPDLLWFRILQAILSGAGPKKRASSVPFERDNMVYIS